MDAVKIAAEGMARDLSKMEVISQNMANVTTSGYKKQIRIERPFASHLDAMRSPQQVLAESQSAEHRIDSGSGTLRATGRGSDIAIEGEGFFVLDMPGGAGYTRNGAMRVASTGQLVNDSNIAFLGDSGPIVLGNGPFSILADGSVRQDGRVAGRLKVVQFDQSAHMVALGGGVYSQGGATAAQSSKPHTVRAGFLENSNVNSTQEMVRMTETVRHFEAMQKVMQGYDETLEKTIRKLGEF